MKLTALFLFLTSLVFGQATASDYVAFILTDSGTVATTAGAKIPTQILIYGRPVATVIYCELTVVTPQGNHTAVFTHPVTIGIENWSHLTTTSLSLSGQTVESITIRKLSVGASVVVPMVK